MDAKIYVIAKHLNNLKGEYTKASHMPFYVIIYCLTLLIKLHYIDRIKNIKSKNFQQISINHPV